MNDTTPTPIRAIPEDHGPIDICPVAAALLRDMAGRAPGEQIATLHDARTGRHFCLFGQWHDGRLVVGVPADFGFGCDFGFGDDFGMADDFGIAEPQE